MDAPLLRRAYLFLGLIEAALAMLAYALVWREAGVSLPELQALAPLLLHHEAPAAVQALQVRASSVAFTVIVLGQVGVLLACRSERRPAWEMLRQPNGLLGLGVVCELLLTASLVLVPALGSIVSMAPFPVAFLPWMALAPLGLILADAARKAIARRRA